MSCEIKVRLPSGQVLEGKFEADDPLKVVALWIADKYSAGGNFLLSIPYPRRVFSDDELDYVTLKMAGLLPKGILIVQQGISTNLKMGIGGAPSVVTPGVKHITSEKEYSKYKSTPGALVVVDFSAGWCGPCKMIEPVFEKLAAQYTNVVFLHVDVEKNTGLSDSADVKALPTFKFFKNGKLITKFSGADAQTLENTVKANK